MKNRAFSTTKRTLASILCLALIMAFLLVDIDLTLAQTKVYVDPTQKIAYPCTTFTVNVNVTGVVNLWAYDIILYYHTISVDGLSVALLPGHFLEPLFYIVREEISDNYNTTHGRVWVAVSAYVPAAPKTGSGTLFTITFHCTGGGASQLYLSQSQLYDYNGFPIPNIPIHGSISQKAKMYIDPPTINARACNTFTANVSVSDVLILYRWQFSMSFDPDTMECISVEEGPFLKKGGVTLFVPPTINNVDGTVEGAYCTLVQTVPGANSSGTIAKVTFHCKQQGESDLTLYNTQLKDSYGKDIPHDTSGATVIQQNPPAAIQNVTFRLLAVEAYMANGTTAEIIPGIIKDFPTKSAQYLIQNLTIYNNWQNTTTGNFNYTSYVHLLSYDPNAVALPYYRGLATNSNVVNEIQNFLGQTGPGESNSLTIRIFYYAGHAGKVAGTVYMALGIKGSDPAQFDPLGNPLPANPSDYEELFDYQLQKLLISGELEDSNCTLLIFDSCYSGGFINKLSKQGRVILTASKIDEKAWGWGSIPPDPQCLQPGQWNWFTGHVNASRYNGANFGPLGLIGGIRKAKDLNIDGWRSAQEIFQFANTTTVAYSTAEAQALRINAQHPQEYLGVKGGGIPLVQFWVEPPQLLPFPYNAPPVPPIQIAEPWLQYRNSAGRTGTSQVHGPGTSLLWEKQLTDSVFGSVVIGSGQAISVTEDGTVHDLDLGTGETIWTHGIADSVIFATSAKVIPPLIDDMVLVATVNAGTAETGTIIALDEPTGLLKWNFTTPPGTGGFFASPAVDHSMVFVATTGGGGGGGGIAYALNLTTGQLIWEYPSASAPIKASLAIADNMVFVATMGGGGGGGGRVYALNEQTGTPAWPVPFDADSPILATPAVADGKVFVATMGGGGGGGAFIYALNEFTGTPSWTQPLMTTGPLTSSPAVDSSKSLVIISTYEGMIYGLNEASGTPIWTRPIGPVNMSSPAISGNGYVYIGSTDGKIYCLNETSGNEIWSHATGSPIHSSPALTDDHVLIGSMNGKVYCFGPPFPIHDTAVTKVSLSKTVVSIGGTVKINVTIVNEGNTAETFNVTISYGNQLLWIPPLNKEPIVIQTQEVALDPGHNSNLTFTWIADVPKGKYLIVVQSSLAPQENDTADNTKRQGTLIVAMVGDITGPDGWPDGKCDIRDVALVAKGFGAIHITNPSSPTYCQYWHSIPCSTCPHSSNCDIIYDGKLDIKDIAIVAKNFGKTDP